MTKLTTVRDVIESGFKPCDIPSARFIEEWLQEVTHVYLDAENYRIMDVDGETELCKMEKVC